MILLFLKWQKVLIFCFGVLCLYYTKSIIYLHVILFDYSNCMVANFLSLCTSLTVYFTWNSRKCTCRLVIRLDVDPLLRRNCSTLPVTLILSFICVIHLWLQKFEFFWPKVVELDIWLWVSITFWFYYFIIQRWNELMSKLIPVCLKV
jgi:hypothetical protein